MRGLPVSSSLGLLLWNEETHNKSAIAGRLHTLNDVKIKK